MTSSCGSGLYEKSAIVALGEHSISRNTLSGDKGTRTIIE
jgi:hypothetical protein